MKKLIILIPLIFIFTGCTDYKELNDIAIITGLAIDIEDNDYKTSVLISNSQKANESNKEGDAGTIVFNGTGKSISEALKNIDTKIPKQLYFGHLAVVIISEDVAKKGIDNISDYLFRNPETTKQFYLIMTKKDNKAASVLKILSPLEEFPSQNIKLNIENANERTAISAAMTYNKFIESYIKKGVEPYLPTLKIYGNIKQASSSKSLESIKPKATVALSEIALFRNSKFIGYTTDDESRGINLINGNIKEMIVSTKCSKKNNIVTAISDIEIKKEIKFKNGKPLYNLNIDAQGDIQEVNCDINLYNEFEIDLITNEVKEKINKLIKKGFERSQKYETDIFGYGNLLYKKNPKYYKKITNWNKEFSNIKINTNIKLNLKTKGSIKQSIKAAIYDERN